jgi:beta-ribofuranosylaminobenzene 5'-phosphate synthase
MPRKSQDTLAEATNTIDVFAPARLHFGFLDLNGNLGRRFGSIGLTLDGIGTRIRLTARNLQDTEENVPYRARDLLATLVDRMEAGGKWRLSIGEAIPEHVGLGSGTQLGLAIAASLAAALGRPSDARTLAPLVERGARSGIGVGAFDLGGFLIDGGKGETEAPAPIVARAEFPAEWRLILIFDNVRRGLSGEAERNAFRTLPPFPAEAAAHLCRLALLRLLPGLAERDFAAVAESIGEINARVGDHFAPAQGGRYASTRVGEIIAFLRAAGFAGVGQSSWGPTGFVLVEDDARARRLYDHLTNRIGDDSALSFRVCSGRNRGAEIDRHEHAPDRMRAAPK